MNKFILLFLSVILSLNLSAIAQDSNYYDTQKTNEYLNEAFEEDDFDFGSAQGYLTEEQMKDAQEIDKIDDNSSFIDKIINSSHFSSYTATKTYIPINKIQK